MHNFKNENGYVSQLSSTTFHGLDGPLVHNQPAQTILVPVGQMAVRPASQKATISNKILTALPDEDFERLASGFFEPVSFSSRQDVREFDGGCCFVYFPQTLVVSQPSVSLSEIVRAISSSWDECTLAVTSQRYSLHRVTRLYSLAIAIPSYLPR